MTCWAMASADDAKAILVSVALARIESEAVTATVAMARSASVVADFSWPTTSSDVLYSVDWASFVPAFSESTVVVAMVEIACWIS